MTKSADAFRTISEVADWLGVPAHVLRFWESKFTQVKPVKRAGGRRYYRPADMQLLGGIRKLLHDDGLTIKGVQKIMREEGVRHVAALSAPLDAELEEAVAEMAEDVPMMDEPRGTVLNFERGKSAVQNGTAGVSGGPSQEMAEDPAPPPTSEDEPIPAAEAPITTASAHEKPDPVTSAASERPQTVAAKDSTPDADTAETRGEAAQDSSPFPDPAPESPPAEQPQEAPAPSERPTGEADPQSPEVEAPRVATVAVPDDPADTIHAPAAALSTLAGLDRATLAAHRPALAELTQRMAALRARMGNAPDHP